jgi:hypothetical protein
MQKIGRARWPRGLRYELSSPARTLGSWVRIPLEAWMSVCIYSVFVFCYVCSGLKTGWSHVRRAIRTVYRITKLKKATRAQQKGSRAIDEWIQKRKEKRKITENVDFLRYITCLNGLYPDTTQMYGDAYKWHCSIIYTYIFSFLNINISVAYFAAEHSRSYK